MKTIELDILQAMVDSTDMATHSIEVLTHDVKSMDVNMQKMLTEHFEGYETFNSKAAQLIENSGSKVKKRGSIAKTMSKAGIKINTLIDKSQSHISEMLMQGTVMGVVEIVRELNAKRGAAQSNVVEIADQLLHAMQNNIEEYKAYL